MSHLLVSTGIVLLNDNLVLNGAIILLTLAMFVGLLAVLLGSGRKRP